MVPDEESVRADIRCHFAADFQFADELLRASIGLHKALCAKNVSQSQEKAKALVVALWTKICKQYRAVSLLCEAGLVEDAESLTRALFEAALWLLFLVRRNLRLKKGWTNSPQVPAGGMTVRFRAEIYLARDALAKQKEINVWGGRHGCKQAARRLRNVVDSSVQDAESVIGPIWMNWLRKNPAALKVELMADNLGLGRWYDAIYRPQSSIIHAGDAMAHLQAADTPMTINVRLAGDVEGVVEVLHLANAISGRAAEATNVRFDLGLGERIRDLANRAANLLNQGRAR